MCLLISSQDYYYDRGLTSFMQERLGLGSASSDTSQTTVTGAGAIYSGAGPYSLSYPFTNYSDTFTADPAGEIAFTGNQGGAAVSRFTCSSLGMLWGFPWEALPTAADRETALQTFFDACAVPGGLFSDGFESGDVSAWSGTTP